MLKTFILHTLRWIRHDHSVWPLRFWVETLAWFMSIGANVMFALTVPNVPFVVYLTITVLGCAMYAWAAWTRRSFGMIANYLLLVIVDGFGLLKVVLN